MTVAEAQAALAEIAAELLGVEDRLQAIVATLPHHPQEEAMLEGAIPCDVLADRLAPIGAADRLAPIGAGSRIPATLMPGAYQAPGSPSG